LRFRELKQSYLKACIPDVSRRWLDTLSKILNRADWLKSNQPNSSQEAKNVNWD
jgi:hypothetical protein